MTYGELKIGDMVEVNKRKYEVIGQCKDFTTVQPNNIYKYHKSKIFSPNAECTLIK